MPSLSTTVTKVLEICNNPVSSPNDLNRVISLDPVLTGQVLRLINSAYYGIPNRVTSLTRAIIMLGINTVKNLVLATSVLATFARNRSIGRARMDAFWEHSLCVGTTSKLMARMCKASPSEQEEYFVAGLLHDLGKLPMMACFGELYNQAIQRFHEDGVLLFLAEREQMGFDHCNIGMLIGTRWKLSKRMLNAIVHHHEPFAEASEPDNLLFFLSFANQMAHHLNAAQEGDGLVDERLLRSLAEHIPVEASDVLAMKPQIDEEIEKARIFLKHTAGE
ncbi:MAG: HDOD domain-containing protein [Desulfobacteraceae bacterium]|nr:HDOD domain-containing protein [Desulfobacteraceae bacterium]